MKKRLSQKEKEERVDEIKMALGNGLALFFIITAVGCMANILLILIAYVMSFFSLWINDGNAVVLSDTETQLIWLAFAAASLALCGYLAALFSKTMGKSAAMFDYMIKKTDRLSLSTMAIGILTGTVIHGVLCTVVGFNSLASVFFAAPVPYIARFIAKTDRTLFNTDALEFPPLFVISIVLIYAIILIFACVIGYVCGYRKHYEHILETGSSI